MSFARTNLRRSAFAAVVLAVVALVGALTTLATKDAFGDSGESATAMLDALANDAAHKEATAAIVQRGRDALERATRMRASGDEAHAKLADGLALEEAETGRDLVRALEAERMSDEARRAATDAGVVGERERALLEEGIARNGRLKAEIEDLSKAAGAGKADAGGGVKGAGAARGSKSDGGAR
ncbi:MAG: hypothetical protein ACLQBL_02980 [Polyangiaceae bacterium]